MHGRLMAAEMAEQPAVLARIVARAEAIVASVRAVVPAPLTGVTFVARGSSDNAATYGRYLAELASGRPAGLAAPSLVTRYGAQLDYRGQLVVGLSQSGATPEIVTVCEHMAAAGARVVAITNDPASPLAAAADVVLATGAGAELAVPATKTVTAQMLLVLLLAAALAPLGTNTEDRAEAGPPTLALPRLDLEGLIHSVAAALSAPAWADDLAAHWSVHPGLQVVGRGLAYGAALETAIKVREVAAIQAQALSAADLLHGPIASMNADLPVLLLDAGGAGSVDIAVVRERLAALEGPVHTTGPVPGLSETLAPIVLTVRGQQLARAWSHAVGRDPDAPAGLAKVTLTR